MGTVRVEHCPECGQMVGEGRLYEHQQKQCSKSQPTSTNTKIKGLTPVSWSKDRGFFWSPDGPYYRREDVDALLASASAQQGQENESHVLADAFIRLWEMCAIQDADDWLYVALNTAHAVRQSAQTRPATVEQTPKRCEGRYPVGMKREEPFDVTYRCGLPEGHEGLHRADDPIGPDLSHDAAKTGHSLSTTVRDWQQAASPRAQDDTTP